MITYLPDKTIYHEIGKEFKLPTKAVKPSYHYIMTINKNSIKASKFDYNGYSVWKGGRCLEDRFKTLEEAKNCAKNLNY